jgi:hypothetical protein
MNKQPSDYRAYTPAGYLLAAALVVATALVSAAALTGGSAQARSQQASAPQNTVPPSISGAAARGSTLAASSGTWSGTTPFTFTYQWRRCNSSGASCDPVAGATASTYTLGGSDVGDRLRITVTATNAVGSATAQSAATEVVASSSKPVNRAEPAISGSAREGEALKATTGAWSGSVPMSFAYQWARCGSGGGAPDGGDCAFIPNARSATYTLGSNDVGHRIRVRVTASNAAGSETVASNATVRVVATGATGPPRNTKEPSIAGTPRQGQRLTANPGGWAGAAPIRLEFQWLRCDGNGNNCAVLGDQRATTYAVVSGDVNTRIRVRVTATNSQGTATATANPTAIIQGPLPPPLPAGAIRLANGTISIPASSVSLPARLVVGTVRFTPNPVRSRRSPIEVRVRVSDTRGYFVRDALVFVRSTPQVTTSLANQRTAQDGWVTLRLMPEADFPLRNRYSVQFFVRARKSGEPVLAGVSTRRLVQVRTAR